MSSPQWLEEMAMDTVLNNITDTTSGCHTGEKSQTEWIKERTPKKDNNC